MNNRGLFPQQLKHSVKGGRVRAAFCDYRFDIVKRPFKYRAVHPVFMTGHPVLIASNGVDLAIMGKHPKWLCQPPCRKGIGRIALMIDRKI